MNNLRLEPPSRLKWYPLVVFVVVDELVLVLKVLYDYLLVIPMPLLVVDPYQVDT